MLILEYCAIYSALPPPPPVLSYWEKKYGQKRALCLNCFARHLFNGEVCVKKTFLFEIIWL